MSDVSLDPASASSAVDLSIAKALRADDAFKATGAVVVLGTPSADQAMPYVVVGEGQTVPDPADSYDGSICYPTLHVWSRKTDFKECKAIAGAIRRRCAGVAGATASWSCRSRSRPAEPAPRTRSGTRPLAQS